MDTRIDWYFDFVSPYSFICFNRLHELSANITYKPVLFAGLLEAWGQKGPAEIPALARVAKLSSTEMPLTVITSSTPGAFSSCSSRG